MRKKQSVATYVAHIQAAESGFRAVVTRDAEPVYEGKVRPNRKAARLDAAAFIIQCPEKQRTLQWDDPFEDEPDDQPAASREEADDSREEMVDVRGHLKWLGVDDDVRKRYPKLWRVLSAAGDSGVPKDGRVTAALLAPVVTAASDRRASVADPANSVLRILTNYFTAAQQAVARMAQHSHSRVRAWAMVDLGRRAPRALLLEVLGRGLSDRSAEVRQHAADQALSHCLRELLPAMEAAAARERNAIVQRDLARCHRLLRDRYILTPAGGGQVELTAAFEGGGVGSTFVSRAELKARGAEAIASEMAARVGCKLQPEPRATAERTRDTRRSET